jgi:outer membrane receptor protein involved in Fe transport
VAGRYDRTLVDNRDALTPGGGTGSLDGKYAYGRFNPSVTVDWSLGAVGLRLAVGQGSRAPSAIELGCADPESPCRLPNALAGDPPLFQVVARTVDLGAHGKIGADLRWNVGVFRTVNRNDILFVADDQAGFGYFRNFGRTRRQGVEAGVEASWGTVKARLNYTYLDATYRSDEVVDGAFNSSNDGAGPGFEGTIAIGKGDRIPLIPRHILKAGADWKVTPDLTLNLDLIALSGSNARGNENGEHEPDGVYYLGPGKTDAYAVVNLGGELRLFGKARLFAQVNNLFDKSYANAAQLGTAGFDANGGFVAQPFAGPVIDGERPLRRSTFYSPGAPRSAQVGVRFSF